MSAIFISCFIYIYIEIYYYYYFFVSFSYVISSNSLWHIILHLTGVAQPVHLDKQYPKIHIIVVNGIDLLKYELHLDENLTTGQNYKLRGRPHHGNSIYN